MVPRFVNSTQMIKFFLQHCIFLFTSEIAEMLKCFEITTTIKLNTLIARSHKNKMLNPGGTALLRLLNEGLQLSNVQSEAFKLDTHTPSLSLPLTHTHTLSLTHSHTHTHTHTHTHSL